MCWGKEGVWARRLRSWAVPTKIYPFSDKRTNATIGDLAEVQASFGRPTMRSMSYRPALVVSLLLLLAGCSRRKPTTILCRPCQRRRE